MWKSRGTQTFDRLRNELADDKPPQILGADVVVAIT